MNKNILITILIIISSGCDLFTMDEYSKTGLKSLTKKEIDEIIMYNHGRNELITNLKGVGLDTRSGEVVGWRSLCQFDACTPADNRLLYLNIKTEKAAGFWRGYDFSVGFSPRVKGKPKFKYFCQVAPND
jgi:hypothetical protein